MVMIHAESTPCVVDDVVAPSSSAQKPHDTTSIQCGAGLTLACATRSARTHIYVYIAYDQTSAVSLDVFVCACVYIRTTLVVFACCWSFCTHTARAFVHFMIEVRAARSYVCLYAYASTCDCVPFEYATFDAHNSSTHSKKKPSDAQDRVFATKTGLRFANHTRAALTANRDRRD